MALDVEDCDRMIAAYKQAEKMLSIGYRLHFDPYHLELAKIGQQKLFGEINSISTCFSITPQKGEWRLNKKVAGGSPLIDVGIYCIQAVCYATGMEPIAVTAQSFPIADKEKFIDIEETINFQLEMPDGLIATCSTSYSDNRNYLKVQAKQGFIDLQDAFNYSGIIGKISSGTMQYQPLSQQAKQMDAFALAIKNNQPSTVSGEMGKRDMKIITAIYESMKMGKRIVV